jgi:hypothetical protein
MGVSHAASSCNSWIAFTISVSVGLSDSLGMRLQVAPRGLYVKGFC